MDHLPIADDLGHPVSLTRPARRVVSLVPSLTESLAWSDRSALVGATRWCTHPLDLDVARVRGTKNPDVAAVVALRPDLVVANQEENRRLDVERLRAAGIPVWVTVIRSVEEAFASLARLFEQALGWPRPSWLTQAESAWSPPSAPIAPACRVVIPIWRDPWMVVGSNTFTGSLVARLGWHNAFDAHPLRYPHVSVAEILGARPDVVVLPDEPYKFGPYDGPEEFSQTPVALVSGRDLTWYGPSLLTARANLLAGAATARIGSTYR